VGKGLGSTITDSTPGRLVRGEGTGIFARISALAVSTCGVAHRGVHRVSGTVRSFRGKKCDSGTRAGDQNDLRIRVVRHDRTLPPLFEMNKPRGQREHFEGPPHSQASMDFGRTARTGPIRCVACNSKLRCRCVGGARGRSFRRSGSVRAVRTQAWKSVWRSGSFVRLVYFQAMLVSGSGTGFFGSPRAPRGSGRTRSWSSCGL
jgi:hypothetical protein